MSQHTKGIPGGPGLVQALGEVQLPLAVKPEAGWNFGAKVSFCARLGEL